MNDDVETTQTEAQEAPAETAEQDAGEEEKAPEGEVQED